ncbi:MAG: hypothetical protein ACKPCK_06085, partial [Dolichospermum sp.]
PLSSRQFLTPTYLIVICVREYYECKLLIRLSIFPCYRGFRSYEVHIKPPSRTPLNPPAAGGRKG